MSDGLASALPGALAMLAGAAHMVLRPHAYLGKGTAPATDPRTVRWFGLFFFVLGGTTAVLAPYQFVTE